MDLLPVAGLKVVFLKEGEEGIKDGRRTVARSSGGNFFLSLLRVGGSSLGLTAPCIIGGVICQCQDLSSFCCSTLVPPFSFHVF